MSWSDLDERVDAYLDGVMTREETRSFEAALVEPEVAGALSEGLLLRELLAHPDAADTPPEDLVARIERALGVDEDAARAKVRRFDRTRAALAGAGWGWRGPALAAAPAGEGIGAARDAMRSWWRVLLGRRD